MHGYSPEVDTTYELWSYKMELQDTTTRPTDIVYVVGWNCTHFPNVDKQIYLRLLDVIGTINLGL